LVEKKCGNCKHFEFIHTIDNEHVGNFTRGDCAAHDGTIYITEDERTTFQTMRPPPGRFRISDYYWCNNWSALPPPTTRDMLRDFRRKIDLGSG
jgi:hypothetical protein